MLYTAVEEAPSDESVEPEVISRHFASFDEVFFTFCDRELKKINTFYSGEDISIRTKESLIIFNLYSSYVKRFIYCRKIGRSDAQVCSSAKRTEDCCGVATGKREEQGKGQRKAASAYQKAQGLKTCIFRILSFFNPPSELSEP